MRGASERHIQHLSDVPLFSACSKKDLQKVARASDEIDVPAGKVLCQEGDTGREFFLILDGKASVKRGKRKVATLERGQFFGELALLDRGPRSATVEADTDMTLLVLGQREFGGLVDEVAGLSHKLLAAMATRLRDADSRAVTH